MSLKVSCMVDYTDTKCWGVLVFVTVLPCNSEGGQT